MPRVIAAGHRVTNSYKWYLNHGCDNFGDGTLDTHMISSFGLNVNTLVSNTNTSASTEEGNGFGQAMLDFIFGDEAGMLRASPSYLAARAEEVGSGAAARRHVVREDVQRGRPAREAAPRRRAPDEHAAIPHLFAVARARKQGGGAVFPRGRHPVAWA